MPIVIVRQSFQIEIRSAHLLPGVALCNRYINLSANAIWRGLSANRDPCPLRLGRLGWGLGSETFRNQKCPTPPVKRFDCALADAYDHAH